MPKPNVQLPGLPTMPEILADEAAAKQQAAKVKTAVNSGAEAIANTNSSFNNLVNTLTQQADTEFKRTETISENLRKSAMLPEPVTKILGFFDESYNKNIQRINLSESSTRLRQISNKMDIAGKARQVQLSGVAATVKAAETGYQLAESELSRSLQAARFGITAQNFQDQQQQMQLTKLGLGELLDLQKRADAGEAIPFDKGSLTTEILAKQNDRRRGKSAQFALETQEYQAELLNAQDATDQELTKYTNQYAENPQRIDLPVRKSILKKELDRRSNLELAQNEARLIFDARKLQYTEALQVHEANVRKTMLASLPEPQLMQMLKTSAKGKAAYDLGGGKSISFSTGEISNALQDRRTALTKNAEYQAEIALAASSVQGMSQDTVNLVNNLSRVSNEIDPQLTAITNEYVTRTEAMKAMALADPAQIPRWSKEVKAFNQRIADQIETNAKQFEDEGTQNAYKEFVQKGQFVTPTNAASWAISNVRTNAYPRPGVYASASTLFAQVLNKEIEAQTEFSINDVAKDGSGIVLRQAKQRDIAIATGNNAAIRKQLAGDIGTDFFIRQFINLREIYPQLGVIVTKSGAISPQYQTAKDGELQFSPNKIIEAVRKMEMDTPFKDPTDPMQLETKGAVTQMFIGMLTDGKAQTDYVAELHSKQDANDASLSKLLLNNREDAVVYELSRGWYQAWQTAEQIVQEDTTTAKRTAEVLKRITDSPISAGAAGQGGTSLMPFFTPEQVQQMQGGKK